MIDGVELKIDAPLLKEQKETLMKLIQEASDADRPDLKGRSHKHPVYGKLWGIVELLDDMQDATEVKA